MDFDARSVFSSAPPSYDENWSMPNDEPMREPQTSDRTPPPLVQPESSRISPIQTGYQQPPEGGPPRYGSDHVQSPQGTLYASNQGEVVLAWSPPQDEPRSATSPTRQTRPSRASSSSVSLARSPAPASSEPITYTFSPSSFNSMLLLPSATAADSRPLYNISVHQNCFVPTSFVTVLRRGGTEQGQYVGEVEMGISNESSTVTMDGTQQLLSTILTQISVYGTIANRRQRFLRWKFGEIEVRWEVLLEPTVKLTCTLKPAGYQITRGPEIAVLVPANMQDPVWRGERRLTTIRIAPAAKPYLDHVLVSALVLERVRRTPKGFDNLFNFSNAWI